MAFLGQKIEKLSVLEKLVQHLLDSDSVFINIDIYTETERADEYVKRYRFRIEHILSKKKVKEDPLIVKIGEN